MHRAQPDIFKFPVHLWSICKAYTISSHVLLSSPSIGRSTATGASIRLQNPNIELPQTLQISGIRRKDGAEMERKLFQQIFGSSNMHSQLQYALLVCLSDIWHLKSRSTAACAWNPISTKALAAPFCTPIYVVKYLGSVDMYVFSKD